MPEEPAPPPCSPRPASFREFWSYYLREHSRPGTRIVHFCGTTLALGVLVGALAARAWLVLAAVPIAGYGLAWLSHWLIERNRPATFSYPVWSLAADFRMWWQMLTGRLWKG